MQRLKLPIGKNICWDKLDKMRAAILFVFHVASPLANICPPIYILCSLDAFPTPIYPSPRTVLSYPITLFAFPQQNPDTLGTRED